MNRNKKSNLQSNKKQQSQKITKKIQKQPVKKQLKQQQQEQLVKKEEFDVNDICLQNEDDCDAKQRQKQARIAKNCWMLCFRRFSRIIKYGDQELSTVNKKKSNKKIHQYEIKIYRLLRDYDQVNLEKAQKYFSENESQMKITSIMKLKSVLKDMGTELEKFMIHGLILWVKSGSYGDYINSISDINSETIRKNNPYRTSESSKILEFLINYQQTQISTDKIEIQETTEMETENDQEIEINTNKKKQKRKQSCCSQKSSKSYRSQKIPIQIQMRQSNNIDDPENIKPLNKKKKMSQQIIDQDSIYQILQQALQNKQSQQQQQNMDQQDQIKQDIENIINVYQSQYLNSEKQDDNCQDNSENQDQQIPRITINNISINNNINTNNNQNSLEENNTQYNDIDEYLFENQDLFNPQFLSEDNCKHEEQDNNQFLSIYNNNNDNSNQDIQDIQQNMEENQQNYQNLQLSIKNARQILSNQNQQKSSENLSIFNEKLEDLEETKEIQQEMQHDDAQDLQLDLKQHSDNNSFDHISENNLLLFQNQNIMNCKKKSYQFNNDFCDDVLSCCNSAFAPPRFSLSGNNSQQMFDEQQ